jgi:hypothetical protein
MESLNGSVQMVFPQLAVLLKVLEELLNLLL